LSCIPRTTIFKTYTKHHHIYHLSLPEANKNSNQKLYIHISIYVCIYLYMYVLYTYASIKKLYFLLPKTLSFLTFSLPLYVHSSVDRLKTLFSEKPLSTSLCRQNSTLGFSSAANINMLRFIRVGIIWWKQPFLHY